MDAILFMKEHSERIPHKNIKPFAGKPLFFYIINTLLGVKRINYIYIDSDSQKIMSRISEHFYDKRIILLDRPEHLRGDEFNANDIIKGILDRIPVGKDFLQTHVTNPLLKASTIEKAIIHYYNMKPDHDTLFAVTKHQACFYNLKGEPIDHEPNQIEKSQDLSPIYEDNSNLYIFGRQSFNLWGRIGLEPYMFEISKVEAIDINTREDWQVAEAIKFWQEAGGFGR